MRRIQRVSAYGLATADDRVLLVRIARGLPAEIGRWMLPGGGVEHGEHPEQAVVRELREETGLDVAVTGLRDVGSDHRVLVHRRRRIDWHCVYFVYDLAVTGGTLRGEVDGTMAEPRWVPVADVGGLPLLEVHRGILGTVGDAQPS